MNTELFGKPITYYEEHSCIHTVTEIAQQPEVWNTLADELLERKEEITAVSYTHLTLPTKLEV